jgi:hypothetical protein
MPNARRVGMSKSYALTLYVSWLDVQVGSGSLWAFPGDLYAQYFLHGGCGAL